MYINRGMLLNIFLLFKSLFQFLNKHFYIILIISTISKYTNNKFYKSIIWLIKIFIFANIIFGIGYIIYFSLSGYHSFVNPFENVYSFYYELLKPYIDSIKRLWNDLISFNNSIEDSFIKDNTNKIRNQVKDGIKDGIKEALDETLAQMHQEEANSNLLKQIAFYSSVLFLGYFIFILPGSSISPEVLTQYNWLNQSLIEFKINIINLLTNTGGNGGAGGGGADTASAISTVTGLKATNTPIISNAILTTASQNSSTQTVLDGVQISRMLETMQIIDKSLPKEELTAILNHANSTIINITD